MTWLSLRLPLPPSTNHAYTQAKRWTRDKETGERTSYTGRMLTEKAAAYKEQVGWMFRQQTTEDERAGLPERLTVSLVVHHETEIDLGNIEKLLIDAIFGVLGRDDRTIWHLLVTRSEHAEPGVVGVQIGGES